MDIATTKADGTIVALIWTVFGSILEVFIICAAGYVLAWRGILDSNTRKQLNRVNVSLATPCLLFSKVAFFLTPAKLKELWIVPLIFAAVTLTSMIVAFVLGHAFRLRKAQRSFAMAAAMFMNTNSLPIALMQSLVITVKGLKWGDDDSRNAMVGRALTYLVLHSTLGMILRWSFGVHLLQQADPDDEPQQHVVFPPTPALEVPPRHPTHLGPPGPGSLPRNTSSSATTLSAPGWEPQGHLGIDQHSSSTESIPRVPPPRPPNVRRDTSSIARNPVFFHSFPYIPSVSPTPSQDHFADSSDEETAHDDPAWGTRPSKPSSFKPVLGEEDDELPVANGRRETTQPSRSRSQHLFRRARNQAAGAVRGLLEFMTAPLWAALLSLVVACTPPLQHAVDVHMKPVKGALTNVGNCAIPVTLIVLGAYFVRDEDVRAKAKTKAKAKWSEWWTRKSTVEVPKGETRTVLVSIVARMVITPLVLLPLVYVFAHWGLHEIFDDPVFVVSTVLVISSPPAITLAQMTQQASGDAFERLISRTIFWAYCVCTPPLTIAYVVLGLYLSRQ